MNYTYNIPAQITQIVARQGIPSVWLNVRLPQDCVHPDDLGAVRAATARLLGLGHRRVAYVQNAPHPHYSSADRYAGYAEAVSAAGLAPMPFRGGAEAPPDLYRGAGLAELLRGPDAPTALVLHSSSEAEVVTYVAATLGLRVPDDLSLVMVREHADLVNTLDVSGVRLPRYQIGRVGVARLLQRMEDPATPLPPEPVAFEHYEGATCAPPPPGRPRRGAGRTRPSRRSDQGHASRS